MTSSVINLGIACHSHAALVWIEVGFEGNVIVALVIGENWYGEIARVLIFRAIARNNDANFGCRAVVICVDNIAVSVWR